MSSSARLNRLIEDAYLNDDTVSAAQAYYDYLNVNCLHPTQIEVTDSHIMQRRVIDVRCGRCFHCKQSKINEWCTRMYAHVEDFKNVYFITLTYRSFDRSLSPMSQLLLKKLQGAVWHLDAFNETKHYAYNPCLLVKKHYQDFLKRLRKNTGLNDITYVLSGEYGKKYGRPHFHAILFTNGKLTKQDIARAWSVALHRNENGQYSLKTSQKGGTTIYRTIGRVDFNDLVQNGTFNTAIKIRVDGTYMNAANCFGYVCKYVCKQDHINNNRVYIAWANLFKTKKLCNVYNNAVSLSIVQRYLADMGYCYSLNNQNLINYEKRVFEPDESIYSSNLQQNCEQSLFGFKYRKKVFDETYFVFRDAFKPFVEFSRATPIGSLYANRHLPEFMQGVFNKPLLQESGFVCPSYFRRKMSEQIYGFRVCRPSLKGRNFVLSSLPLLHRHLSLCDEFRLLPRWHDNSCSAGFDVEKALQDPSKVLKDLSSGCRILMHDNLAHYYKYDRHQRKYINVKNIPVSDLVRSWLIQLQNELQLHSVALRESKDAVRNRDAACCKLTDLGIETSVLKNQYVQHQADAMRIADALYHEVHRSVE